MPDAKTGNSSVKYYSFDTISDIAFPISDEFVPYENFYCAAPDDDYVSLLFIQMGYIGGENWKTAADTFGVSLINEFKENGSKDAKTSGPKTITVCNHDAIQYSSKRSDGALLKITCINSTSNNALLCVVMTQDPGDYLENNYEAAYTKMIKNVKKVEPKGNNQTAVKGSQTSTSTKGSTNSSSTKKTTESSSTTSKPKTEIEKKGTAVFNSYEDIYNEYSQKMKTESEKYVKTLEEETAAKKIVDYLAESAAEKMDALANLCAEGIDIMAEKATVFSTSDYMSWATKLESDYMVYYMDVYSAYTTGVSKNMFY